MDALRRLCWKLIKARVYPEAAETRRQIEQEGQLCADQWRQVQAQRLAKTLQHAKETVPYYRSALSSLSGTITAENAAQLLENAPLLRRQTLQEHCAELISESADKAEIYENATGGSTGKPVIFYQDLRYDTVAKALDEHVRSWIGVEPGDRVGNVWGADKDFKELSFKDQLYSWSSGVKTLNAFEMKPEEMAGFYKLLSKWRPPYLMGYSSALEAFALYCRDNGGTGLRFKGIRSSAEKLWPHQRELIEEIFQSPVYNFYGSREINNLAAECPEGRNMHLFSTYRFVEIVDEQGRRLPPGESGLIAITDLSNYSMPLIRYVNEDVGTLEPRPCSCGRPSPMLAELAGRSTDLIRLASGEIIHGEFFTHLFYGREEVKAFQVHQTSLEELIVRLVMDSELSQQMAEELKTKVGAKMGQGVNITIEQCDAIPVLPSGKFRFTISDVTAS